MSHALEALYDTPKGQITKILVDRVSLFLELSKENSNKLKRKIREFYELRSRYVHGELDISIPINNEVLDKNMHNYRDILFENYFFGFSIVLATIQKMIENNWTEIVFFENYKGT